MNKTCVYADHVTRRADIVHVFEIVFLQCLKTISCSTFLSSPKKFKHLVAAVPVHPSSYSLNLSSEIDIRSQCLLRTKVSQGHYGKVNVTHNISTVVDIKFPIS